MNATTRADSSRSSLDVQETGQFLLAAGRLALQKLEAHCPEAPETALLMLAIHKAEGLPTAEG